MPGARKDRAIPGFSVEQSSALFREFSRRDEALAELADRDGSAQIFTSTLTARAGQFLRVSPGTEGMAVMLPPPRRTVAGDRVTISLEGSAGPLRLVCVPNQETDGKVTLGTVNRQSRATFTVPGLIDLVSNGDTNWQTASEHPAESAAISLVTIAGSAGATGAAGATGPQGAPGLDGNDGSDGQPGPPGAPGSNGAAGPPGAPGSDGSDGADGPPGPAGANGAAGAPGATGASGPPGLDGQDGADGPPGPPGATGATGAAGGGGGSSILVPVTVNLGTVALWSSSFDITGLSGLTLNDPVLVTTGVSLTNPTESEEQLALSGIVISATTIRVYWESVNGPVSGTRVFNYLVASGVTVATGAVRVEDDGALVLTAATTINFDTGLQAIDQGGGQAGVELNISNVQTITTGGLISLANDTEVLAITSDILITGITVPVNGAGRVVQIRVDSGINCVLENLNAVVSATERIACPLDTAMAVFGRQSALLIYQSSVWRVVGDQCLSRRKLEWKEDFDLQLNIGSFTIESSASGEAVPSTTNWRVRMTGTGAGTGEAIDGINNHPGIFRASTNANADSGVIVEKGSNTIIFADVFQIEFICRVNTITTVFFSCGFADDSVPADVADIFYDPLLSANLQARTSLGGTATITDTGVAMTTGFNVYTVRQILAGTVQFLIDDVLVATHTTNIPTAAGGIQASIENEAAAIRTLDVDYGSLESNYLGARTT